jgi:hypothetical protein
MTLFGRAVPDVSEDRGALISGSRNSRTTHPNTWTAWPWRWIYHDLRNVCNHSPNHRAAVPEDFRPKNTGCKNLKSLKQISFAVSQIYLSAYHTPVRLAVRSTAPDGLPAVGSTVTPAQTLPSSCWMWRQDWVWIACPSNADLRIKVNIKHCVNVWCPCSCNDEIVVRPCHGCGGQSPGSHLCASGSVPPQSM